MNTLRRRLWLCVLGGACLLTAGCPTGCDEISKLLNPTGTSVQSVTIAPAIAQLTVGQTMQFTATVLPTGVSDRTVTWLVVPAGAATIDTNGILTAIAPGQVTVTATTVATPVHNAQAVATIISSSQ
jgi:uncharacterized protein YjdB